MDYRPDLEILEQEDGLTLNQQLHTLPLTLTDLTKASVNKPLFIFNDWTFLNVSRLLLLFCAHDGGRIVYSLSSVIYVLESSPDSNPNKYSGSFLPPCKYNLHFQLILKTC